MDADKIKDFFIHHCEKMVLVLFVAGSLLLIYQGLQQPNFLAQEQPDQLTTSANQVKTAIDENHNENILPERQETEIDIVARAEKSHQPVNSEAYALATPWELHETHSSFRRQDPDLLAPRDLQVAGQLLTIAGLSKSGDYPLQELENAEPLEKTEQKPDRRERRRNRRRGGAGGSSAAMEEQMGMGMGSEMGMGMGSEMGMGMGSEMGMGSGMGSEMGMGMESGMGSMGSTSSGGGRKFNKAHDFGMRPTSKRQLQPVPKIGWFVAGTAVVPHRELIESYKTALQDAQNFRPERDQPAYYNYQLQRADVTDKAVDELTEDDWVNRENRLAHLRRAYATWAGFAPELAPQKFRDPMITGYIPPVLLEDYADFAMHPLVPLAENYVESQQAEAEESEQAPENVENFELAAPGARGGIRSGGGGSSGMGGSMEMGMGSGMGGEMGMGMGMGSGMGMGMGSGMGGYGSSMRGMERDPAEYKLMRFYDFVDRGDKNAPRPGRKYVYRVRFAVIDPNFPASPQLQPKANTLSAETYSRVAQLMARAKEEERRDFQRWSDWSEPSAVVSLPDLEHYFAGPVQQDNPRSVDIRGKRVEYSRDQPTGKIVVSQFNMDYQVRMPMWMDVTEGSVLSKTGDAQLVDPITLTVKTLPDAKIVSGTTVIDLDGGRPLAITEDDDMTEPGLMLMFDEHGGLTVTDEVDDHESYRIWSFADERGL